MRIDGPQKPICSLETTLIDRERLHQSLNPFLDSPRIHVWTINAALIDIDPGILVRPKDGAQILVFGNVVVLSVMFCMEQGFLGAIIGKGGPELFAQVRSKCKNMAQYEEFTALDNLGVLLFQDALLSIDDRYKERKALAS